MVTYKDVLSLSDKEKKDVIETLKVEAPKYIASSEFGNFRRDVEATSTAKLVDYATIAGYVNAFEIMRMAANKHVEEARQMFYDLAMNNDELFHVPQTTGRPTSGYALEPFIQSKYLSHFSDLWLEAMKKRAITSQDAAEITLKELELKFRLAKYEKAGELVPYNKPDSPESQPNNE